MLQKYSPEHVDAQTTLRVGNVIHVPRACGAKLLCSVVLKYVYPLVLSATSSFWPTPRTRMRMRVANPREKHFRWRADIFVGGEVAKIIQIKKKPTGL